MAERLDRALDRLRLRRAPSRPRQIHLSVTDRCFLPCMHCDIWKTGGVDLPARTWLEVIDRLAEWCAPAGMNFVGGEPLLRADLERLMARAVAQGFEVSFNTNAWLLTPERARSLSETGASVAYISLDGARAQTVDRTRGRVGSFDKALAAIDLFQSLGRPRVEIATVLHADNAAEMPALLALVRARGLRMVVQPLYQNFGADYDPDWWRGSPLWPRGEAALEAMDAALDLLSDERDRGGAVINPVPQLQAMKGHFRHPTGDNGELCRAGHTDLSFDPQGNVRLCYFLEPIGTIFDLRPFALMWDGPRALRRRWEVSRCGRHCNLLNCNFDEG